VTIISLLLSIDFKGAEGSCVMNQRMLNTPDVAPLRNNAELHNATDWYSAREHTRSYSVKTSFYTVMPLVMEGKINFSMIFFVDQSTLIIYLIELNKKR
jgi:hypothetical protein